jgi:hypothetical protein
MTTCQLFSIFSYAVFCRRGRQSNSQNLKHGIFNSNNGTMNQNKSNWQQNVAPSKLLKTVFFGLFLAISSLSYSQSNANVADARMRHDNSISIRSGLHDTYKISMGHFGFSSTQEAITYFQTRNVDYINFVVVDKNTLLMHFDLNNPALAGWTIADWEQALESRAANSSPRPLTRN